MRHTVVRGALVVLLAVQSWSLWNDVRHDRAMSRGIRAYNEADVEAVREAFREARGIDDDDPYLWAWSGDAALYVYDYHTDGAEIDPAFGRELLDEAWRAYGASVLRSPSYAWSWAGLAGTATRRVDLDRARRGVDLGAFGRLGEGIWDPLRAMALESARIARSLNPNGYLELDVLADVWAGAGERDRAAELLRESATIMPAPSQHPWGVGRRLERGLYATVLEALEAGVRRAPGFEHSLLHLDIGRFAHGQGDLGTALAHFRSAYETARNDFRRYQALVEQSKVHQELGEFEQAIATTREVLDLGYAVEPSRRRLATLNRLLGRFEEACDAYRSIRMGPEEMDAWRVAGALACERAGEIDAAERMLRDGLGSPVRQPELARALLQLYVDSGRESLARFELERWIERNPEDERLRAWRREFGFDLPPRRRP